jgi:hypothetical protein
MITTNAGWWFGSFFIFHILGIIIPTDFHVFQTGWSTTNQNVYIDIFSSYQPPLRDFPAMFDDTGG